MRKETFVKSQGVWVKTFYVRDAAGSVMAVYRKDPPRPLELTEHPVYGLGRLGIYYRPSKTYAYQLTDHLGNVRAVVVDAGGTAVSITNKTDYYPFGMPMPGRHVDGGYRYAFQGQKKDDETGMEAFQLRLWDSRIGRWLTVDPMGEFYSPYLGMANNPVSMIDPDGGCVKCPNDGKPGDTATGADGFVYTMGKDGIWWSDAAFEQRGLTITADVPDNSWSLFSQNMTSFFNKLDSFDQQLMGDGDKWAFGSGTFVYGSALSGFGGTGRKRGPNGVVEGSIDINQFPIPFTYSRNSYSSILSSFAQGTTFGAAGVEVVNSVRNEIPALIPETSSTIMVRVVTYSFNANHDVHNNATFWKDSTSTYIKVKINARDSVNIENARRKNSINAWLKDARNNN